MCKEEVQGIKENPKRKKSLSNLIQRNHKYFLKLETMKQQVAHFNIIPMKMKDQGGKKSSNPIRRIQSATKQKYF